MSTGRVPQLKSLLRQYEHLKRLQRECLKMNQELDDMLLALERDLDTLDPDGSIQEQLETRQAQLQQRHIEKQRQKRKA